MVRLCGGVAWVCRMIAVLAAAFPLLGCGAETYELRLQKTQKYLEYLEKVNGLMAKDRWRDERYGLELRVPKQFFLMPAPQPVAEEAAEPQAAGDNPGEAPSTIPVEPRDPRQPDYLDLPLPGLVAAWRANLEIAVGNELGERAGFIYLCSNHQLLLDRLIDDTVKPLEFHQTFSDVISAGLNVAPDVAEAPWKWDSVKLPSGHNYVAEKVLRLSVQSPEEAIDDVHLDFMIYRQQEKDIQVVLLFVIPREVERSENIPDGITFCLESLRVSPEPPRSAQKPADGKKSDARPTRDAPAF